MPKTKYKKGKTASSLSTSSSSSALESLTDSDSDSELSLTPEEINMPKEIAGYKIEKVLGQGAYGKVFKALDPVNNRIVALKQVHCQDQSDVFYLQREIAIHLLLNHPNIVNCYEARHINSDTIALVLEFLPGMELLDKIQINGFLSEQTARGIFRQIVSAVGYLQSYFIVHRDLKPENIMINFDGTAKLMDFGFANFFDVETRLNSWCGTLNYSSPEIVNMQSYAGPDADNWSLGVVLYTMLTGMMPFGGSDAKVVSKYHANLVHKFPKLPSRVSRQCKDLLQGILKPDPSQRLNIMQIASHPWLISPEYPTSVDFKLAPQKHPVSRVDSKILATIMQLYNIDSTQRKLIKQEILTVANSRIGIAYRIVKREKKFDTKNLKPQARHSQAMQEYWTSRIVYVFKKITF